MDWSIDGSVCPACGGEGRGVPRYPAALCYSCVSDLVDEAGRKVELANEDLWGGVRISVGDTVLSKDAKLFVNGIECRAREARFGGVVVQPVEAWERSR